MRDPTRTRVPKRHSIPIGAASAANASGLLETVLSKVRRPEHPSAPRAILAGGLPIRSIVFHSQKRGPLHYTAVFGIYRDTARRWIKVWRGCGRLVFGAETKAPEGATTGGVTGGVIGGTLGWLAGMGALAIPGLGPFIAAGPIMGLLAGAGAGGAIGGFVGSLVGRAFRNMSRPSDTRGVLDLVGFYCRFTAMTPNG